MKTKFFLLLISIVFIISLSACGNLSNMGSQSTVPPSTISPEQTVQTVFEALKNADSNVLNQLIQYNERRDGVFIYKDNTFFGNNLDEKGKELMKSIFANLSYEIGQVKENGDTATAQIKITNRDLSNVGSDILRYKDADNPLIEAIKNADDKTVTTDTEITLNKTNGKWKIQMDKTLVDALCGGLLEIQDKIVEIIKNIFKS